MDDLKLHLYKCFQILDQNFFDNFEGELEKRIIFQKYGLFFSFFFGLSIGNFSLYVHGPYNSDLAEVGYEFARNKDKYSSQANVHLINKNVEEVINLIQTELGTNDVNQLELFSTYFYLRNKSKCCEEEARKKLSSIKDHLLTDNPQEKIQEIENSYIKIKNQLLPYQLEIA